MAPWVPSSYVGSADRLPVLTESGEITDVTPLDRDRSDEALEAIARLLRSGGRTRFADASSGGSLERTVDDLEAELDGETIGGTVSRRLRALLERYDRPYPSLVRIRIDLGDPLDFVPGQFVTVRYRRIPRTYSIANPPGSAEIELCVRRVPAGRLTPRLASELGVGDRVTVRGPFGDFGLEPASGRDLLFLATGTGVAPFKSMIEYAVGSGLDEYRGEKRAIWLFLGAPWEDDLPYGDFWSDLARTHEHVHFVPTCSRERFLSDWDGETSYVQETLLKYVHDAAIDEGELTRGEAKTAQLPPRYDIDARLDPRRAEVYACGVTGMVSGLLDVVDRLGVPEEYVHFEGYG